MTESKLLLTPGPLNTSTTVKNAMLKDLCTRDEHYSMAVVQDVRLKLLNLIGCNDHSEYTSVLMQGAGTMAVESVICSTIKKTDKLLIVANGAYGERIGDMADKLSLNNEILRFEETVEIDPAVVDKYLQDNAGFTHLVFIHCETTTGIVNPLPEISKVAKSHNCVVIVDAMSSFGGMPIDVRGNGIDYIISSANKCIQGVPGFGFVIANVKHLEQCAGISPSVSLDLYDQWQYMQKTQGQWRFTSATHTVLAFQQALQELADEGGIDGRFNRYSENQEIMESGMAKLGFKKLLTDDVDQSPIITSFYYPDSADFEFDKFYEVLKEKGFIIYPGKVSKAPCFRIGTIGDIFPQDIKDLLVAIEQSMYWQ